MIELLMTVAVVAISGGAFYWILSTVIMLGARNAGVNVAHQEGRVVLNHAVMDLHNSPSVPQLIDSSLAAVSGNGPSAGVSYQIVVAGPGMVNVAAAAGQATIGATFPAMTTLAAPTSSVPAPAAGMRFILPAYQVESDIASVAGGAGTYTFTLSQNLTTAIDPTSNNYQCYYTQRRALVVVNGAFRYYTDKTNGVYQTLVQNVTSATPFSYPGGNNQYIQASITTTEPFATARGYNNLNFQATITVPYRYNLTTYP